MSGIIPDQYEKAARETLIDLRNELGGDRDRTSALLVRSAARFVGQLAAEALVRQALLELQGVVAAPAETPAAQTLWPAYSAPTYCGHGYPGENEYREAAHDAARAAGLDCIRFKITKVPNPELSMHLFYYRSPVDGHILGDWYKKAKAKGITRWQVDITECTDVAAMKDRLKDYPPNTVQWIR